MHIRILLAGLSMATCLCQAVAAPPSGVARTHVHPSDVPMSLRLLSGQKRTIPISGANALEATSVRVLDSKGRSVAGLQATLGPINRQTNSRALNLYAANVAPGEYRLVLNTRDPAKFQTTRIVVQASAVGNSMPGRLAQSPIRAGTSPAMAAAPALRQDMLKRQQLGQSGASQRLGVVEPRVGARWVLGNAVQVRWTPGALAAESVSLWLYPPDNSTDSSSPPCTECVNLGPVGLQPNSGIVAFTLPHAIRPGEYVVRVRDADDSLTYLESGVLRVVMPPCPTGPRILRCQHVRLDASPVGAQWDSRSTWGTWPKGVKNALIRSITHYSTLSAQVWASMRPLPPFGYETNDPVTFDVTITHRAGGYSHTHQSSCGPLTSCLDLPHNHYGIVVATIYLEGDVNP